jgi:tape measure domain-containing protein
MLDLGAIITLRDNMSDVLRRASRETSGLRDALGRVGSGIGTVTSKFLSMNSAIIAGVGALGAYAVASRALKLSSDAEQASIAFETMLGSADKAKTFLEDLSVFANTTPFELPQVRDASKKLLAFGFEAKSVIPMMTAVGNAASGLGLGAAGIDRITLALGQIKAKQKVQGDEMLQLTEAGIPAWQLLADKMGLTVAQVMKLSEKGLIPADKAIDTLIEGMNKKFPDMMKKQSQTLQGLWSTMKDTFDSKILIQFGNGIANALRPRFLELNKWINNNGDTIKRWGDRIASVTNRVADGMLRRFEQVASYVKRHYLNNPEFTKLDTIEAKTAFVFQDLKDTFDEWYAKGGSEAIYSVSEKFTRFLANSIDKNSPIIIDTAKKLGGRMGQGIIDGLEEQIAKHPILSTLAGGAIGGAVAGPWGALGGALVTSGAVIKATDNQMKAKGEGSVFDPLNPFSDINSSDSLLQKIHKVLVPSLDPRKTTSLPPDDELVQSRYLKPRAIGVPRVPHDNYPIMAHEGERLLTKQEVSQGKGGGGNINIAKLADTVIVREEADIDKIVDKFVTRLTATRMNYGGGVK